MVDIVSIVARYNSVKQEHDTWVPMWRDCRTYVQPQKVDNKTPGTSRGDEVYDNTAIDCNLRFASGFYAWLCPTDKRWFELQPMLEELQKIEEVSWYFSEVNKLVYQSINNSNWPLMFHESALNLGSIGTGILYCEEGENSNINFQSIDIEDCCILENHQQLVDSFFREYEYTARQCFQKFGYQAMTPAQKAAYDANKQETKFKVLHVVMPRENHGSRFGKLVNTELPFASYWIDLQTKIKLLESGYWENPFTAFRFLKNNKEPYGRGAGMNNIQEIKMLNRFRKADIIGTEKAVDPPILIPENGLLDNTFRAYPGGINFIKTQPGEMSKPEPFFDGANLPQLEKKITESRMMIRAGFFVEMFDALGDKQNMSATEVIERAESKLIPFAPVLGRMQSECFNPVINRVYGILSRAGKLPPPPQILLQYPSYKVEYVSRISMAIKQLEAKGWLQTFQSLAPMAQINPGIFDNFDMDQITRDLSRNNGLPSKWLLPVEKVAAIRQGRAQQQAQQIGAMQAVEAAKALPAAGKAPEHGSPLKALMGAA